MPAHTHNTNRRKHTSNARHVTSAHPLSCGRPDRNSGLVRCVCTFPAFAAESEGSKVLESARLCTLRRNACCGGDDAERHRFCCSVLRCCLVCMSLLRSLKASAVFSVSMAASNAYVGFWMQRLQPNDFASGIDDVRECLCPRSMSVCCDAVTVVCV